jgi:hypothetical protein
MALVRTVVFRSFRRVIISNPSGGEQKAQGAVANVRFGMFKN